MREPLIMVTTSYNSTRGTYLWLIESRLFFSAAISILHYCDTLLPSSCLTAPEHLISYIEEITAKLRSSIVHSRDHQ